MFDLDALATATRADRVRAVDDWLAGLFAEALAGTPRQSRRRSGPPAEPAGTGVALVAVGSLGRRELPPLGDLDLVLVHDGRPEIAALADALWYPIWDAGVRLDHSVRTIAEAVSVAGDDVKAGLGLLDARHVAGDPEVTAALRTATLGSWRQHAGTLLPQLRDLRRARGRSIGELGFLLEPDLKEAYGGLREGQVLRALAAAQLADEPPADAGDAYALLLDVRDALRRSSRRPADALVRQEQRPVAAALGFLTDGEPDDDALLRQVSLAGRRLAFVADETWRRVDASLVRRPRARYRRVRREPLAEGLVRQGDEVVLARDAHPASDPGLVLRGAAAAARADLLLSPYTLKVLAVHAPPLPEPWPSEVRWSFLRLLASGRSAVPVLEQLDQEGLLARMLPEWDRVRSLPQRHPWHRFTVDRHLVEAAAAAAELTRDVDRPDLLLVGALLHDIGKGWPGDHTEVGVVVVAEMAARMGFSQPDVDTLVAMVRHHLLLPHTASRRDPEDPSTVERVVETLDGDPVLLELLHALAEADSLGTGPGVWTPWRATLMGDLVRRCRVVMAGEPTPAPEPLGDDQLALARSVAGSGRPEVSVEGAGELTTVTMTVAAPDRPGLLSRAAGVLALHSLQVHAAVLAECDGVAVDSFTVSPRFGRLPEASLLREDLVRVLAGSLDLPAKLAAKERDYAREAPAPSPSRVLWFDDEASGAVVLELRTADRIGLLHRVADALEGLGIDVRWARVSTLGSSVVDAFCLETGAAGGLDPGLRTAVEQAVLAAVGRSQDSTRDSSQDRAEPSASS